MTGMDDERPMRPVFISPGYQTGRKTPTQIEGDIAATRTELGEIVGALEYKLAPRRLLASGVDGLTDAISQNLRRQPMPLALVGLGLGWLLMAQRPRSNPPQATRQVDPSPDDSDARWKSGAAMRRPHISLDDVASPLNPAYSRVGDRRPLALAVLGIVAGAVAALMLPRSAAEERLIRPAGERLREETANLGREAGERVADLAIDAAVETVRHAVNDAGRI